MLVGTVVPPGGEVVIRRALRRQVVRQESPLTAGPGLVENRVHDLPHRVTALMAAGGTVPVLPGREHRLGQRTLPVRQIALIRLAFTHPPIPAGHRHQTGTFRLRPHHRATSEPVIESQNAHSASVMRIVAPRCSWSVRAVPTGQGRLRPPRTVRPPPDLAGYRAVPPQRRPRGEGARDDPGPRPLCYAVGQRSRRETIRPAGKDRRATGTTQSPHGPSSSGSGRPTAAAWSVTWCRAASREVHCWA